MFKKLYSQLWSWYNPLKLLIKHLGKGAIYYMVGFWFFFPPAPSEQYNKLYNGISMQPGYPQLVTACVCAFALLNLIPFF